MFLSRDLDSWILEREKHAVEMWTNNPIKYLNIFFNLFQNKSKTTFRRHQFHIMRDHPQHQIQILAGLWGANNYQNLTLAKILREKLFAVKINSEKTSDQDALRNVLWPVAR